MKSPANLQLLSALTIIYLGGVTMPDKLGQQLGNYRLVRLLGTGGFAEVYLGQHLHLASKQAAIKILHLSDIDAMKFRQEAETTEQLVHPHIVRLLDFDLQQGTPFLVLDYAPGGSLRTRHLRGRQLSITTVKGYLKEIASALQYAHDQHILHRDIKQENMLIGRQGELLLSDFGIAVFSQTGRPSLQAHYGIGGTPFYMAPEQYRGKPEKASDQYALAVVVYEWLGGTVPFSEGDFIQLGYQHTHEFVPPLRDKNPSISPETEAVIMRALAKDPGDRFESVQAFASAFEQSCTPTLPIEEHLPGQGIPGKQMSSDPSSRQRGDGGQPSRYNVVHANQVFQDERVPNQTTVPARLPEGSTEQSLLQTPLLYQRPREQAAATSLTPPVASASTRASIPPDSSVFNRPIRRRIMLIGIGLAGVGLAVAGGEVIRWHTSQSIPPSLQPTPTVSQKLTPVSQSSSTISQNIPPGVLIHTYKGHSSFVWSVAWSPDSKHLVSGGFDNTVEVWNATDGSQVFTYTRHSGAVYALVWSPDSTRIASAGNDNTVQVWNATDGGHVLAYSGHSDQVWTLAWSPNGSYIVSAGKDNVVRVWNATNGSQIFAYQGHSDHLYTLAWSPDSTRIASAGKDNVVQVWNATDGGHVLAYSGHSDHVYKVAWSPNGSYIASAGKDNTVQVWHAADSSHIYTYNGHTDHVYALAWSPDSTYIASAGKDNTVQVWQVTNGTHAFTYQGHADYIDAVA